MMGIVGEEDEHEAIRVIVFCMCHNVSQSPSISPLPSPPHLPHFLPPHPWQPPLAIHGFVWSVERCVGLVVGSSNTALSTNDNLASESCGITFTVSTTPRSTVCLVSHQTELILIPFKGDHVIQTESFFHPEHCQFPHLQNRITTGHLFHHVLGLNLESYCTVKHRSQAVLLTNFLTFGVPR